MHDELPRASISNGKVNGGVRQARPGLGGACSSARPPRELQIFAEIQHAYHRDDLDLNQMSTYLRPGG